MPMAVTKQHGIKLVEDALKAGNPIGVVALRDRDASPPGPEDVHTVGTVAIIQKMIKVPDGTLRCIISGTVPFRVEEFTQAQPYLAARVEQLEEITPESDELTALSRNLAGQYTRLLGYLPSAPKELELEVNNINDPNLLSYFIASDAAGSRRQTGGARRARYARTHEDAHGVLEPLISYKTKKEGAYTFANRPKMNSAR